ncbi:MAG: glycerophosphodiester phosphodiesterase [Leptolyngbyaceae cyanobacterium CSU_1_4]|nr:glycerophosphodiester phosphodiesterase [Leptolyngbyaceae cyanobacterium CSU_1_4]
MKVPLIIAHRGGLSSARENTLAAFEDAIALQADWVEVDVRSTQDGVLIIHHDPEIQQQPIEALTWAEIQHLDPDVPTLEEAIACCQGRIGLDVEIKEPGYETAVVQQLQRQLSEPEFVITSFYLGVIRAVKENSLSKVTLGFLMDHQTLLDLAEEEFLGHFLQAMGVTFVAPSWQIVDSPVLKKIIPTQMPFWVWTVNDGETMQKLLKNERVEAIVTDQPKLGLQLRTDINR